jgi:uncharacterized membrane protein
MLALQKQQLITVEDAAIMWRDTDGKPKLTQLNDMAGVGALGGAFWGMLFGLLFFIPVIGLALGAATGAIVGSMSDVGIDDKFIKQVGESITPGTSALFLLTSHALLDKVLEQTKDLKYEILQSNLSQQDEEKLRAAISASGGSAPADTASMESVSADSAAAVNPSADVAPEETAPAESVVAGTSTAETSASETNTSESTSASNAPADNADQS